MLNSFTDAEEMEVFCGVLDTLVEELEFQIALSCRIETDAVDLLKMKRICLFCIFVRENMELVQQLVNNLHVTEVDEDEFNQINDQINGM